MGWYIIFHYNVLDRERIEELGPRSLPIIEKYGGELVVGNCVSVLEGDSYSHMVAYRFADQESADKYYNSPESRELSKLRKEVTDGVVLSVPACA